jgi:O-6-methylguanine DNA methyltransferase
MAFRIWTAEWKSPIGRLFLAHSGAGLSMILYVEKYKGQAADFLRSELVKRFGPVELIKDRDYLSEALGYLELYFKNPAGSSPYQGKLDPGGTSFQRRAWKCLKEIPAGKVLTYGQVARRMGQPKAARAVGGACATNPLPIIIPCHRVIGSGGQMVGFGLGLPIKERLLKAEGWRRES